MKKLPLVAMLEASFLAALAFIFDLLPSIKLSPAISISFAMVPIFILAFRWGVKVSFVAGFLWGLLQVALGDAAGQILTPLQGFIEFFIAFAFIGVAGIFRKPIKSSMEKRNTLVALLLIIVATFVGSAARYFWHFIAGFIFWAEYAPEDMNPVLFSFTVNGVTMLGAATFCSIILAILIKSAPSIILQGGSSSFPKSKKVDS